MSYASAAVLQEAVFQHLVADTQVQAKSGGHVYDAMPVGVVPALYAALGPETVRDASDGSGAGAEHDFEIAVISEQSGFAGAKDLAAAISQALADADLTLAEGRLVGLWFRTAKARHQAGLRRIDMRFRARVDLP